ncbi:MAG: flagellin FliC [Planctomycetes bacterium]|nr:flagellin FliC [Planctomycetota bacterium]MCB9920467.1 flagellin FliC [Planctomycetota bacterium]
MGLRVNTNVASINAQRNLESVTGRLGTNYRRLSTGLRITTAADDAAGLAISERLRSQVRSLSQSKRNANDGISLVQTAEGALNESNSILIRMRELAIQASNGTVSPKDKTTLNEEFTQLRSEIERIAKSTEFNSVKLLDGSASETTFQVGFGTTSGVDTVGISLTPALATSLSLDGLSITGSNAAAAISAIDNAIDKVSSQRGSFGAVQNRLSSTINNLGVQIENLSAAESRIRDVDVADETAQLTRNSILQQAATSILAQANVAPQSALSLLG